MTPCDSAGEDLDALQQASLVRRARDQRKLQKALKTEIAEQDKANMSGLATVMNSFLGTVQYTRHNESRALGKERDLR